MFLLFLGPNNRGPENTGDNAPWSDTYDDHEGDEYYDDYDQGPPPREQKQEIFLRFLISWRD